MQSFLTILKCLIGLFFMIVVIYAVIKIKRRFINSFDERYGGGRSKESRRNRYNRSRYRDQDDLRVGQGGFHDRDRHGQRGMRYGQQSHSRNRNGFGRGNYNDFQDW